MNEIPADPYDKLRAPVTHGGTGETSEFGLPYSLASLASFTLERDGPQDPAGQNLPGTTRRAVVQRLTATAGESAVVLRSLKVDAQGSLPEDVAVTNVFLAVDNNANGVFDEADLQLSEGSAFAEDNDRLDLVTDSHLIPEGGIRKLLVMYEFDAARPKDLPFQVSVIDAAAVQAETVFPAAASLPASGMYPIESDIFTFLESAGGYVDWRAIHFSGADLTNNAVSGPGADPDQDGIRNAVEFALGLNPNTPDNRDKLPNVSRRMDEKMVYKHRRLKNAPGATLELEASTDLLQWFVDNRYFESVDTTSVSETQEDVEIVLSAWQMGVFLNLKVSAQE